MKNIILVCMVLLLSFNVYGFNGRRGIEMSSDEILDIVPEASGKQMDELTLEEYVKLNETLSIKMQEQRYIHKTAAHSAFIPGTGQFSNGDILSGSMFLAADLAIIGGTLYGMSILKPEGHDFYVDGEFDTEVMMDTLPALGVLTGGITLAIINRVLSSSSAEQAAIQRVESGEVVFTPQLSYNKNGFMVGFKACR